MVRSVGKVAKAAREKRMKRNIEKEKDWIYKHCMLCPFCYLKKDDRDYVYCTLTMCPFDDRKRKTSETDIH